MALSDSRYQSPIFRFYILSQYSFFDYTMIFKSVYGALPTWRQNDVETGGSPDMAAKRRRDRVILPTWRQNDVGTRGFPRHGGKTTSGEQDKS